jgi:hypothetical protein
MDKRKNLKAQLLSALNDSTNDESIKLKKLDNVVNKLEGNNSVQINEQTGRSELKGNSCVQINGNLPPHMAELVKEIIKR